MSMYVIRPGFTVIPDKNEAEVWRVLAKMLTDHEFRQVLKQLPAGGLQRLPVSVLSPDNSIKWIFRHLNICCLGEITALLTTILLREHNVPLTAIQDFQKELARFGLVLSK